MKTVRRGIADFWRINSTHLFCICATEDSSKHYGQRHLGSLESGKERNRSSDGPMAAPTGAWVRLRCPEYLERNRTSYGNHVNTSNCRSWWSIGRGVIQAVAFTGNTAYDNSRAQRWVLIKFKPWWPGMTCSRIKNTLRKDMRSINIFDIHVKCC